jgi:hypothetical protein
VWTHLAAVIALALLCGLWMLLQLYGGAESRGATGECAACASKRDCEKTDAFERC